MTCRARIYGSQTICARCGLTWDTNDPEPPACNPKDQRTHEARAVAELSNEPAPPPVTVELPLVLPAPVAVDMSTAYRSRGGGVEGMQAAYRVLLDGLAR